MIGLKKRRQEYCRKGGIKAIAFYLPQYHRVPENDMWWGKGFTDWCAVKSAIELFPGHNQPRVPKRGYYNLCSKKTLQWQSDLVKKAGLHGLCFYHYWFKNGKKILEKPAELLLREKDIDMKFCFSWANESWIRTWSNIKGNAWVDGYDVVSEDDTNGVLLEQEYGTIVDWKKHFEYLLPFFRDERYIKYDGKPVFVIYKPELSATMTSMLRHWKQWAVENGLNGIYIIGTMHNANMRINRMCDAELLHSPNAIFDNVKVDVTNGVNIYDYDECWKEYLKIENYHTRKRYLCGVVDYDTTPRKGKRGKVLMHATPTQFYRNFSKLVKKSKWCKNDFVFINAWNEWGESMYLEPDCQYGNMYLKALNKVLGGGNR